MDRLKEQGHPCHAVNVSAAANDSGHFANLRSEIFWKLRERFQKGEIDLTRLSREHLDRLTGELTAIKFKYTSAGKLALESKDEIKKRLGYSPDLADALAMAFMEKKMTAAGGATAIPKSSNYFRREPFLKGPRYGRIR